MNTSLIDQQFGASADPRQSAAARHVRVLHLINGEHYSGAERVQDLLAMRLRLFGYDVSFACLKPGRFAAMRQSTESAVFETHMRSRFDLSASRRLAHLICEQDFDLLHTHTPRAAVVGGRAARLAGVPLVHHVHSPTASDSTHWLRNRLNAALERRSLTDVSAVVAVSRSLVEYAARQGIAGDRISVVPNGVPAVGPLASRLAPSDAWTLGVVALFRPRKGLEVLLDALALLRDSGRKIRLRAVGSFETPGYESLIKSQVQRLSLGEVIDWIGFTRDVPRELEKMDLFVLPSLFGEGMPMVVLEAMAAGIPVVGTLVEGVPEVIRHEIDGLLTPPSDARQLAAAIARFMTGEVDWARMRDSAHRRHAACFSDHSMAAGVAAVYDQVLKS